MQINERSLSENETAERIDFEIELKRNAHDFTLIKLGIALYFQNSIKTLRNFNFLESFGKSLLTISKCTVFYFISLH